MESECKPEITKKLCDRIRVSRMSLLLATFKKKEKTENRIYEFLLPISFAFVVAVIPTGTYKNLGYVDPNMYVGYGKNLEWFIENVTYEYHATRLPLILVLKVLLSFSSGLFGFLFKFLCFSVVSVSWYYLCKNFKLSLGKTFLGALILLMSPLVVSASSWTFTNSFAIIISCLLLPIATKGNLRVFGLLGLGVVLTNVAILNVLFSILCFIFIIPLLLCKGFWRFTSKLLWIGAGSLSMWVIFELLWKYVLGYPGAIWKEQLNAISSGTGRWAQDYWKPLKSVLGDYSSGINLVTFLVFGFLLNTLLFLFHRKHEREMNSSALYGPTALLTITVLVLYAFKIYIGFTEIWYFYIFLLCQIVFLLNLLLSSNIIISRVVPEFILFVTIIYYLEIQVSHSARLNSEALFLLVIALFVAAHRVVEGLKQPAGSFSSRYLLAIPFLSIFGWALLFSNPTWSSSYISDDNQRNSEFLREQLSVMNYVARISDSDKGIALWTGNDPTGVLGGLESTLSFHKIRLDLLGPARNEININDWSEDRGFPPNKIIVLVDADVYEKEKISGVDHLKVPDYCVTDVKFLQSGKRKVFLLDRVLTKASADCL
jgi:hypothetical protein